MTDAKVLADALVEAGIGAGVSRADGTFYRLTNQDDWLLASAWITDWRVAGKVLESMNSDQVCDVIEVSFGGTRELITPRAIIEAWYEVQNND